MQAAKSGRQSKSVLSNIEARDSMPVSTGAATRGGHLGRTNKKASGAPERPEPGTRHHCKPGNNPQPVKQSSSQASQ